MKLKILKDHDHRITPAKVQAFKADKEVDVPRKTADVLLKEDGVAVKVPASPSPQEK